MLDYYQKTGVIPVNHMVIVQEKIMNDHPWVALELYKDKAFQKSKEVAYERAREFGAGYLFFVDSSFQEQTVSFGPDPTRKGQERTSKC